jgi:hypothetical protein
MMMKAGATRYTLLVVELETSELVKLIPDEHFDLRNAAISWYPALFT